MVAKVGDVAHNSQHNVTRVINRGNVAPLPREVKSARKKTACASLRVFLETYFPDTFGLEWAPVHLEIINQIEDRIKNGGLKALALPRGSGKTSIMLRAAIWAIATGRRKYVCIVAANEDMAVANLRTIKAEINSNEKLSHDFRREFHCVLQLGGEARRTTSQNYNGADTGVDYSTKSIGFGCLPNTVTSGATISTAGITGQIRGQIVTTVEGKSYRPDLVLVDDPQTKSSAGSASQVKKRHEVMMGDILGLAGPGVKISGFCTCTVIYQNDLADRLLDPQASPEWHGSRVAMIQKWPKWREGWDKYYELRREELFHDQKPHASIQFVRDNYDRLHEGAQVYWEERKSSSDVSALHHAMDLYYRDIGVFYSEFQNAPMSQSVRPPFEMNPELIVRRVTGLPRSRVPIESEKITAFIDVQKEMLYYLVCAWTSSGRCYVIDYGGAPDQQQHYWTKSSIRFTMQDYFGDEIEESTAGGLNWLTDLILSNDYTTEDGSVMQVDKLAIDARWGETTHVVRRVVRESRHRGRMHPSMGMYIGATSRPWQKLKSDRKDKKGIHAKLQAPKEPGAKELLYDTNFWKSFVADRLTCGVESPKAITLFDAEPHEHRMIAEHCCFEEPVRCIGKAGNEVVEWKQNRLGGTTENDLWDCLVGNAALASTIGVRTHAGRISGNGGSRGRALERVLKKRAR